MGTQGVRHLYLLALVQLSECGRIELLGLVPCPRVALGNHPYLEVNCSSRVLLRRNKISSTLQVLLAGQSIKQT